MTTKVRNVVVVALLAAGLGLTGCGSDSKTVKTADGSKVTVKKDGEGLTVKNDQGEFSVGQGLPDGFPKDEVPLVDGKVLSASKGADGTRFVWSVLIQVDSSVDDAAASAKSKLEGAGFTAGENSMTMGEMSVNEYNSSKYKVSVTVVKNDEGTVVTYAIQNAG